MSDADAKPDLDYRLKRLADAITPNLVGSADATGGHVESLTEAAMGITAGLCRIADAIDGLADAIREAKE
jgi:hypothetical protein